MIKRLTAEELREIAFQLDGINQIINHGNNGAIIPPYTVLTVNKEPKAYLYWWDAERKYIAEFLDFTPGDKEHKDFFGNVFKCVDGKWDLLSDINFYKKAKEK